MLDGLSLFEAAAVSSELRTPLEVELDHIRDNLRSACESMESVRASVKEHDESFPSPPNDTLAYELKSGFEKYENHLVSEAQRTAKLVLCEGRSVDLSDLYIEEILKLPTYDHDPHRYKFTWKDVVDRWNSRALIKARDELVGVNLDDAAWSDAVIAATKCIYRRGDFNEEKRTVFVHGLSFEKSYRGNNRYTNGVHSWHFPEQLSHFLNVAEALANGTRECSKTFHPAANLEIFRMRMTEGLPGPELFRWHPLNLGIVTRVRPYKDGGLAVEFSTTAVVTALMAEIRPHLRDRW